MSRKGRKHGVKSGVDVVITTSGRWDFLKECLESIKTQDCNIYVVDHASDPEERIQNQGLLEGVTSKRLQQQVGFPAANNEGARMGAAPLILFLNDDCILFEDAIEKMEEVMQDGTIGVCGAKLVFPLTSTNSNRPAGKTQHVGLALSIRGDTIHPLVGWSADHPKTCKSRDVFAVTGACLMTRRNLFNRLNGFDPTYGLGTFEDVDYCLKIRQQGLRVYLNAEAKGYHYAGATAEKKKISYPLAMNQMIFKTRWMGSPFMAWGDTNVPPKFAGEYDYW